MWRFTQQSSDPPAPTPEGVLVTGRFYTKLVSGILKPFIRDSNGVISDFVGPTGPQGIQGIPGPQGPAGSGMPKTAVANINDPSTELASLTGATGDPRIVYQDSDPSISTLYVFDSTITAPNNSPFIVAGTSGKWIASGGRYTNSNIDTAGLVEGRNLVTDGAKLDGIESGATAETGSVVAPPNIAAAGAAGSDTGVYANADHTHGHGNQAGGTQHAAATTSVAGFMSASDKTKLDNLATDPFAIMDLVDDFASGSEDVDEIGNYCWRNSNAGTGNQFSRFSGVSGHPGILRLQGGTVDAGRSAIHLGDTGLHFMVLGGGVIRYGCVVRLTGVLSTHEMTIAGLGDVFAAVGDQNNGVYFQVLGGGAPDTNWHLVAANSGTRTRLNSGIAFVSGNWIKLEFEVNASGTSIEGFIDGLSIGTITTNIPAGAISPVFKTDGIAAGVAIPFDVDLFRLKQVFTTPR